MATVDELKSGTLHTNCVIFCKSFTLICWLNANVRLDNCTFVLVLKETLENRGVLGQIRARVRAEVFGALDDQVSEVLMSLCIYNSAPTVLLSILVCLVCQVKLRLIMYLPTFFSKMREIFVSTEPEFPKIYRRLPKIAKDFGRPPRITEDLRRPPEIFRQLQILPRTSR